MIDLNKPVTTVDNSKITIIGVMKYGENLRGFVDEVVGVLYDKSEYPYLTQWSIETGEILRSEYTEYFTGTEKGLKKLINTPVKKYANLYRFKGVHGEYCRGELVLGSVEDTMEKYSKNKKNLNYYEFIKTIEFEV